MSWLILTLFLIVILELLSGLLAKGFIQKLLAYICIFFIVVNTLLILFNRPSVWASLLLYFSIFRIINLFKLIDSRKQIDFLRSSFIRSSLSLALFQVLVLLITYLVNISGVSYNGKWVILSCLQLIGLIAVVLSLRRAMSKTRPELGGSLIEDSKLPTLTVAIPARNETEDLEECLSSLVESDYPKLEILVLDDCSQEKRTPEIIRGYAHRGVRFLEGKVPDDSWTAKNFAYEQLYEEANGDVIIFCGVDARFDKQTLREMVSLKLDKRKTMISFMPLNELQNSSLKTLLIQPMRYLWELGLPRRSLNRPPVLSTCWLIDKKALKLNGGFKAVSRSVIPERYFARSISLKNDGYSFICIGNDLGFISKKSFSEQIDTAIRTRYPLVRQRLESVSLISFIEAMIFIAPIGVTMYEIFITNWWLVSLGLLNVVLAGVALTVVSKIAYGRNLLLALFVFPVVYPYDICLAFYSMWQYEFNEVVWKGRNVCIPVMGIIASKDVIAD